jgi:hypothetical protein
MVYERYNELKQGTDLFDGKRAVFVADEVRIDNRQVCEAMDSLDRLLPEGFDKICKMLPDDTKEYTPVVLELPMKPIQLGDCPRVEGDITEQDFVVRLQRPDGTIIEVLIPDAMPDHYTRIGQADAQQEPYGLNLVCRGHYT